MCISICPLSSSEVAPKTKQSRVTLIIPILDQPIGSHPPTKISRAPSSPPKTCGQKIRAMNNQGFSNAQVQDSMGDLPAASALRSTTSASSFVKYVSPPRTAESQQVTRVPDRKSPRKTRPQEFFGCLLIPNKSNAEARIWWRSRNHDSQTAWRTRAARCCWPWILVKGAGLMQWREQNVNWKASKRAPKGRVLAAQAWQLGSMPRMLDWEHFLPKSCPLTPMAHVLMHSHTHITHGGYDKFNYRKLDAVLHTCNPSTLAKQQERCRSRRGRGEDWLQKGSLLTSTQTWTLVSCRAPP